MYFEIYVNMHIYILHIFLGSRTLWIVLVVFVVVSGNFHAVPEDLGDHPAS